MTPDKIHEEPALIVGQHMNERRRFLRTTAVAATLVAASVVGFGEFPTSAESVSPNTMQAAIAVDFATLDGAYTTLGRVRIEAYAAHENYAIANRTLL